MIEITVDGSPVQVDEGANLLSVLKAKGKKIPAMCYHPALTPAGACKLCVVEITEPDRPAKLKLSCATKTRAGQLIRTQGPEIAAERNRAFAAIVTQAPQSEAVLQMAREYGFEAGRLPDGCIRCRLCIRVCREVVGAGALKMETRGDRKVVVPIEGRCIGGATCVNICPTRAISMEDRDNYRIISIRDRIIGRHPLATCEGCGTRFTTPDFLSYVNHQTTEHPDVKEHHRYCPICAKLFSGRIKSLNNRM